MSSSFGLVLERSRVAVVRSQPAALVTLRAVVGEADRGTAGGDPHRLGRTAVVTERGGDETGAVQVERRSEAHVAAGGRAEHVAGAAEHLGCGTVRVASALADEVVRHDRIVDAEIRVRVLVDAAG